MSDYKGALFPKPKRKKRKRLMNGYKTKLSAFVSIVADLMQKGMSCFMGH